MARKLIITGTAAAVALLGAVLFSPTDATAARGTAAFAPRGLPDPTTHPAVAFHGAQPQLRTTAVPPSSKGAAGCTDTDGSNVRVDIDCTNIGDAALLGRGQQQSSAAVAANPRNPANIIATSNDYREGDSRCGADFSTDGGRHWGGSLVPANFTTPGFATSRHYWDVGGLSSVAFDSSGEAYLVCDVFGRGSAGDDNDAGTGIIAFRSGDGGGSWSFPASLIDVRSGATNANNSVNKPWLAVDTGAHSPYRDRLYVAWVTYNRAGTSAEVSFAYSADHGASWHRTGAISGSSAGLCPVTTSAASGHRCDNDQFPEPVVAPDGTVYVVFQNFNTCTELHPECDPAAGDNHDQILLVRSRNGGQSFSAPVKVADYYEFPDCFTYTHQDQGLGCLPTAPLSQRSVFEGSNYPSAVATAHGVVVSFGSYLNAHSNPDRGNCRPNGVSTRSLPRYRGVGRTNGCNNDIVVSTSTDGMHFTGAHVPPWQLPSTNDEGTTYADQWWQWAAPTPDGRYAVAYYDRKYGSDQRTGSLDVSLRTSAGTRVRVTNRSLPPDNEFPDTGGYSVFMGDYLGLAVGTDGVAHPVWMDTRNPIFVSDPGDARLTDFAGYGTDLYTRALPGG